MNRKDRALAQRLQLGLTLAQQGWQLRAAVHAVIISRISNAPILPGGRFFVSITGCFPDGFPQNRSAWWFRPDESFPCLQAGGVTR